MKALITGIIGQDGAYLAKLLLEKGYRVTGAQRRGSTPNTWRLKELGALDDIEFVPLELAEESNVRRMVEAVQPDEIYNLAALSFVPPSFECPLYVGDVNGLGVTRLLEAVRFVNPDIRFYQASTSEMFGLVRETPQSETTPFRPRSPYGIAKLYAHWMVVNYRESYGIHACNGILFNHESPLRSEDFVTRKITAGLARIKRGEQDILWLGNLASQRDWGFAGDYVAGMWAMLQQERPDDYVLATGQTHTVRNFVEAAAKSVGFDIEWDGSGSLAQGFDLRTGRVVVKVDPAHYRPADVECLLGDATKARDRLGWRPSTDMAGLAKMMMAAELARH